MLKVFKYGFIVGGSLFGISWLTKSNSDHSTLNKYKIIMENNANLQKAHYCLIMGNFNSILSANRCLIMGNFNSILDANHCLILGNNVGACGNNNIINGNYINVTGNNNKINGNHNKIIGDDNINNNNIGDNISNTDNINPQIKYSINAQIIKPNKCVAKFSRGCVSLNGYCKNISQYTTNNETIVSVNGNKIHNQFTNDGKCIQTITFANGEIKIETHNAKNIPNFECE